MALINDLTRRRHNDLRRIENGLFPDRHREIFEWNPYNEPAFENFHGPKSNIKDIGDHYVIEMAIPGIQKEDIEVEVKNGNLTIKKEAEESEEEKQKYMYREHDLGSFERSFKLPENVVEDPKIEADLSEGILKISIPKRGESKEDKGGRKIPIE